MGKSHSILTLSQLILAALWGAVLFKIVIGSARSQSHEETLKEGRYLGRSGAPPPKNKSCQPDREGSWSIGMFRGASPFQLKPTSPEPIVTCASVLDAPSNFVADPFFWRQPDGTIHLFYETKSIGSMHGDIGVSRSTDNGASWTYMGIALDEPWHLSYPFVFSWDGKMYMLPDGCGSRSLLLYEAVAYPLKWRMKTVLLARPMIDATLIDVNGTFWMFTSDVRTRYELEIFYAASPLGPWRPHAGNPVMHAGPSGGGRMGGRLLKHSGRLYRFGQDCGTTYGHQLLAFQIDELTPTKFNQTRVPFSFLRDSRATWNKYRNHHLDAQQLDDGSWIAVMDGDSQAKPGASNANRQGGPKIALAV